MHSSSSQADTPSNDAMGKSRVSLFEYLAYACLTGLFCAQAPLLSSNQNSYFFHGVASLSSQLQQDWLASTRDPFPLFSLLVRITEQFLRPEFFNLYFMALVVLCSSSIFLLLRTAFKWNPTRLESFLWFLVFSMMASFEFGQWTRGFLRVDFSFWFMEGVAGQYVLRNVFQPCVFGVVLFWSMERFVRGRVLWACVLIAVTTWFHASYLLPGAMLCAFYAWHTYRNTRNMILVGKIGASTLLLCLPVILYGVSFMASDMATVQEAQGILYLDRIPHHANVEHWLSHRTFVRLGLLILGGYLARNTVVGSVIAWLTVAGFLGTLAQVITNDMGLALVFPWRSSVIAMPLATAVMIQRGSVWIGIFMANNRSSASFRLSPLHSKLLLVFSATLSLLMVWMTPEKTNTEEIRLADEMRLICHDQTQVIVPPNWADFRLRSDCPVVVDSKTHPYQHDELIEWKQRLDLVSDIYASTKNSCEHIRTAKTKFNATHIVQIRELNLLDCPVVEIPGNSLEHGQARLLKLLP